MSRAWDFARRELSAEGETLHRAEQQGPFVAALIELTDGGYTIRVGQPSVIERGRKTELPLVTNIGPWGPTGYSKAASRFNKLMDEDLS